MRRSSNIGRWVTLFLLLVIVAAFVFSGTFQKEARPVVIGGSAWLLRPFHAAGSLLEILRDGIEGRIFVHRENRDLKKSFEQLFIEKAEFLKLQKENEDFRKILGLRERFRRKFTSAEVIGEFSEGREEYIILDTENGAEVSEGAAVLTVDGTLLGVVRTVTGGSATARLFTSPSENLTVLLHPAGVEAVSEGNNNGEYTIVLVPQSVEVKEGDLVTSSGRNTGILAGIPLATIVAVERLATEAFLRVKARSPVNAYLLNRVVILE